MQQQLSFYPKIVFRSPSQFLSGDNYIDFKNDSFFSEALFLASPLLHNEQFNNTLTKKAENKLNLTLYKYRTRLCNRCTPFGLFAGIGLATWQNESEIELSGKKRRKTRLDTNILCSISDYISKHEKIVPFLKYYVNNSIYKVSHQIRYIEYFYRGDVRVYQIASIDDNPYLQKILKLSKSGEYLENLACNISDSEVSKQEAASYIKELIDSQILQSEIEPTVTGDEYSIILINTLERINILAKNHELENIIKTLKAIKDIFETIDLSTSDNLKLYELIKQKLLSLNIQFNKQDLFQADLSFESTTGGISYNIQEKLLSTVKSLNKLVGNNKSSHIQNFKKKFNEKYEGQSVALPEVLDSDIGVGYPVNESVGYNPLIDDVYMSSKVLNNTITFTKGEEFLYTKLLEAVKKNKKIVIIDSTEIDKLETNSLNIFPDVFSISFNIVDAKKNKVFLKCVNENSTSIIGRFGLVNSKINEILEEVNKIENRNNPSKIFAEIVHLPQARAGNILSRENFREYEIPYIGRSSVSQKNQILISDLYLSVNDDYIMLWSKSLKKEIIPRMANAHNFRKDALPIYHFLCDIQNQRQISNISFDWGNLSNQFSFLPRVEIDGVIVFLATWNFNENDFLFIKESSEISKLNKFRLFLKKNEIPLKILYCEYDNELLFDFDKDESIFFFLHTVQNKKNIVLKEYLLEESTCLIKDKIGNKYSNECIAFITSNSGSENTNSHKIKDSDTNITRKYILGSEWLFYKIYTGNKTSDKILTDYILPLSNELENRKIIEKWFYIRYSDPDPHIRLRFNIKCINDIPTIIEQINLSFNQLILSGIVSKIVVDTYIRELERYGFTNIENTEKLFHIDSKASMHFLSINKSKNKEDLRWHWALINIDQMLSDFGFDIENKQKLFTFSEISFSQEFDLSKKENKIQLDAKFRNKREEINSILDREGKYFEGYEALYSILQIRSSNTSEIIKRIKKSLTEEGLEITEVVMSYIHMTLNRIFVTRIRENELMIYNLLAKYYNSTIAKKKAKQKFII